MLPSIIIPTSPPPHQAALIHVSVLLGLGSDVGIIIEGSIVLIMWPITVTVADLGCKKGGCAREIFCWATPISLNHTHF